MIEYRDSANLQLDENIVALLPADPAGNGSGAEVLLDSSQVTITPNKIPASAVSGDVFGNSFNIAAFDVEISWPDTEEWKGVQLLIGLYHQVIPNSYIVRTFTVNSPSLVWSGDNTGRPGQNVATFESKRYDETSYQVDFMALVEPTFQLVAGQYEAVPGAAPTIEAKQGESMLGVGGLTLYQAGYFYTNSLLQRNTIYKGSFNFTFSKTEPNEPIRIRLIDEWGRVSKWYRIPFRPVGSFEHEVDGNDIHFDGSASYDPDGEVTDWMYIEQSLTWGFDFDEPTGTGTVEEPGEYQVRLQVTDNEGFYSVTPFQSLTIEGGKKRFGSFVDKHGVLYTAVNEGSGVRVSRFKSGVSSRELLALIPNAKNPCLSYNAARNTQKLSYTSGGQRLLAESTNGGKEFV